MKLNAKQVEFIYNITRTCQQLDMLGVIIEVDENKVRSATESNSLVIVDEFDSISEVLTGFDCIYINRLSDFNNRISLLLSSQKEIECECMLEDLTVGEVTKTAIVSMSFKNKRSTVNYRCANPAALMVPKNLKNKKLMTAFSLSKEDFMYISKAATAMSSGVNSKEQNLEIFCNDDNEIKLTIKDGVGDALSMQIDQDKISDVAENPLDKVSICKNYPLHLLLAAFKANNEDSMNVVIKPNGFLMAMVNGIAVFIICKAA